MPNILPVEKKITVISALAEGCSVRGIERMTGIHQDTISRLSLNVGSACQKMLDEKMRELPCQNIEVDEMWGFIVKKQRNVTGKEPGFVGDVWTYVALDAETKLIPCFAVGKRDSETTNAFIADLATRMKNRVQLTTDGMNQYISTIEEEFGTEVDYGQSLKVMSDPVFNPERRYSQPFVKAVATKVISGNPDPDLISTSHVERQNLTIRTHSRRLTRLTNAFSKKIENHRAALALHFSYYNFVKNHKSIRCTPAMEAGVANDFWTVRDLIELAG